MSISHFPNATFKPLEEGTRTIPWFSEAYPRRYRTPEGYIPTWVHALFSGVLAKTDFAKTGDRNDALSTTALVAALRFFDCGAQYFWIQQELGAALMATRAPEGLLSDTPWPFQGFCLMVPHGLLPTSKDGYMSFINVGVAGRAPDRTLDRTGNNCLFMHGASITEAGIPRDWFSYVRTDLPANQAFDEQRLEGSGDVEEEKNDARVLESLCRLVINACYCMAIRPEQIEVSIPGGKRVQRGEQPSWWEPRWVGRKYQTKRDLGGSHASPRVHWRRGHWRQQAVGEGRKGRKQLWIEPILVNSA